MYFCVQHEVVATMNKACRIYNETTTSVKRSIYRLKKVISKTHIKFIKNIIIKEYEKLFVVAYPHNEVDFLEEVNLYISKHL